MSAALALLFFVSGTSALIYQVVWVREFGNVFGNTVYSASLVVAVVMFGLGVGGWIVARWADRADARRGALLPVYGRLELAIGVMGLLVAVALLRLDVMSAAVSSYSRNAVGWYVPSIGSYAFRIGVAIALLAPISLAMGGTLTLLIRHIVSTDLPAAGRRIALLYGVNTAGSAAGALLTDFVLVPSVGLYRTQWIAALLNAAVGAGALCLHFASRESERTQPAAAGRRARQRARSTAHHPPNRNVAAADPSPLPEPSTARLAATCAALALSGFAAMGAEILWFRHFTLLLGGFRAVFSLLLAVILAGIGVGSLLAGVLPASMRTRPAQTLMAIESLFIASMLAGIARADAIGPLTETTLIGQALRNGSGQVTAAAEMWLNARPILLEVAVPALLMGFAFPLANAIVQRTQAAVARRAGLLYLSNTLGAVVGSLAAGFLLIPILGIQSSATVLAVVATLSIFAFSLTAPGSARVLVLSLLVAGAATGMWLRIPSGVVVLRAMSPIVEGQELRALSEGVNEVVTVIDTSDEGRQLLTNGHPMSSTSFMSQRYMRALAHIPLLAIDRPERALVIGFGVGNTTDAVSLHPTIRRIDVADLSTNVLAHADAFRDANQNVLADPRVAVYVNDGRQHLRMMPPASYDLITLEPPPLALAGVGALYSEEFYALARSRLKPRGYVSQWLPAYQVSEATVFSMIRAFTDVFPASVLISGADAELILLGVNDSRIEIDPAPIAAHLAAAPAVEADLRRLALGTPLEIAGTFLASPQRLAEVTRDARPATDDRPVQEYDLLSRVGEWVRAVPQALYSVEGIGAWCPACFANGRPAPIVDGLDAYLGLLSRKYANLQPADEGPGSLADARTPAMIEASSYLTKLWPNAHALLGVALARSGRFREAVDEFRIEAAAHPDSATAHWSLGDALVSVGTPDGLEAGLAELQHAVELDSNIAQVQADLGDTLLKAHRFTDAITHLQRAVELDDGRAEVRNNLGIAFASLGRLDEAIDAFREALRLQPDSASARNNLAAALARKRG